jgi:hypothetical protein
MSSYAYFFPLIPVGNETNQTRTRKFFPEFEFSIKKPTCRGHCPKSKPYSKPNKPPYKSSTHKLENISTLNQNNLTTKTHKGLQTFTVLTQTQT